MKKLLFLLTALLAVSSSIRAQSTRLYDDTQVSSVYLDLPVDSFQVIMTDVWSDHYFQARFIFDDGFSRDTLYNVGLRLRGNTSRYAHKKSFKVSFNEYVSGRKYQGVKKLNLNGQHNDPTLVREKLFYDLWNKAGFPERRTSFVRLYINQVYYGLYTNLEEFDKSWLTRNFTNNAGNLYKCTWPADLVYLGSSQQVYKDLVNTATGERTYDLQTNETLDDYTDLVELITQLNQTPDSLFVNAIQQLIDVNEFLKAYAFDVATGNWDNYAYNKNNYFLYHHPFDGKFSFISYDTDNTFGVDWIGVNWATRNCLDWMNHSEPRPLITKLMAIGPFYHQYQHYLDSIARYIIAPDSVFPRLDSLRELIIPDVLADTFRCLDYGYTFDDFNLGFTGTVDGHTPWGIKPFLGTRSQYILNQLPPSGIFDPVAADPLILFPNPAREFVWVELKDKKAGNTEISLYDSQGRKVPVDNLPEKINGYVRIPLEALPSGVYLLSILSNKGRQTARFIHE